MTTTVSGHAHHFATQPGGVRRRTGQAMACFAPPEGLRDAAHCFNRAHAQQSISALSWRKARGHVSDILRHLDRQVREAKQMRQGDYGEWR